MSNTGSNVRNDPIRELAGTAITGTYQVLGGPLTIDAFRLTWTNNTNGDIYVSTDGVTDMMKFAAQSARITDDKSDDLFRIHKTQFYIRYDVAPGSPTGWFTLESEHT